MPKKVLILLAALSVVSMTAAADESHKASARGQAGHIMVEHAWARASLVNNGAAYLMVVNGGKTADRLIEEAVTVDGEAGDRHEAVAGLDVAGVLAQGGEGRLGEGAVLGVDLGGAKQGSEIALDHERHSS